MPRGAGAHGPPALRVGRQAAEDQLLDGDGTAQCLVGGEPDRAHATTAQQPSQPVAARHHRPAGGILGYQATGPGNERVVDRGAVGPVREVVTAAGAPDRRG